MKIEDLRNKWLENPSGDVPVFIQHSNNKTVRFYPTSLSDGENEYILNGFWYCIQTNDLLVPELIKIKKEDISKWNLIIE